MFDDKEKEVLEEPIILNASVPILAVAKKVREEIPELIGQAKVTEPERDVLKAALRAAIALYDSALAEPNPARRAPKAGIAHEALNAVKVVARLLS